jgi:hypothetical protein
MTVEEEMRSFAEKYIFDGERYLAEQPVPGFHGLTWEQVFAGELPPSGIPVSELRQRKILQIVRNTFGSKDERRRY